MKHPCLSDPVESSRENSQVKKNHEKLLPGEKWVLPGKILIFTYPQQFFRKIPGKFPENFYGFWKAQFFPEGNHPPKFLPQRISKRLEFSPVS